MLKKYHRRSQQVSPPLAKNYITRTGTRNIKNLRTLNFNNPFLLTKPFAEDPEKKVFKNGEIMDFIKVKNTFIYVVKGDITNEETGAIVNAANSHLAHGGGVAGAISKKGGRQVQEGSNKIVKLKGPIPTGSAIEQFAPPPLKCRYIIHAVGPIYVDGQYDEEKLLSGCIEKSLEIADSLYPPITSISFPAVSSGIFGYPKDECANVFFTTILNYIYCNEHTHLRHIRLTNFDTPTASVFYQEIQKIRTILEGHYAEDNKENMMIEEK